MPNLLPLDSPVQREHQLALVGTPADSIAGEVLPQPVRETGTTEDGFIFDLLTGEVLGRTDAEERFEVRSLDAAEWVLELRSQIEGRMHGLAARKAAVVAMIDLLIAGERRKLSWWETRLSPSLVEFAREQLGTGKSRTWRCAWGQVAFRKTKGSNAIINDEQAMAFVELWAPELVKVVRSVNVTSVKGALEAAKAACPDEDIETPFLASTGETESVTVSTGIEVRP